MRMTTDGKIRKSLVAGARPGLLLRRRFRGSWVGVLTVKGSSVRRTEVLMV
jgi:hypothetical protein